MSIVYRKPVLGALAALLILSGQPVSAGLTRDRIFQPPTASLSERALPAGVALISVTTTDALALSGLAIAPTPGKPLLLIFHGNASSASDTIDWLAPLIAQGYGVVAAEYRGYSANPGKPSEKGLATDADAFFAYATTMAAGSPVIVIGHSLGSGVAFGLAIRQKLDALVTVGAFTSVADVAPGFARMFIADRFDNLAAVPAIDEPLFIIHSSDDDVIPAACANALYKRALETGKDGAAIVLDHQGHRSSPTLMADLVARIAAVAAGQPWPATTLPVDVKILPFAR